MPRKARIDSPGALHHTIIRGIGTKTIFRGPALKQANEDLQQKYQLAAAGPNFETLLKKVAEYYKINPDDLKTAPRRARYCVTMLYES